jgi:uncharacterized protein with HEPN domain
MEGQRHGYRNLTVGSTARCVRSGRGKRLEMTLEAAKNIPDDFVAKVPEIAWRDIRGMKDILGHGCFGTYLEM